MPEQARTHATESIDNQSPTHTEDTIHMKKLSKAVVGIAAAGLLVSGLGISAVVKVPFAP